LAGAILLSVLTYTCIGLFEELARAYHLRNLLEGTHGGWLGSAGAMAVAVSGAALISVLMHRGSTTYLLYVAVASAVLGLFYLLTGRMALAAGAHMAYDFMLFTVFGVGAEEGNAIAVLFQARYEPLIRSTSGGIDLTPTGLALVLMGEAVGLLVMLGWVRLRHGRIRLQEGLATPALRWRERIQTPNPHPYADPQPADRR
jgi:membrane protease YdiL (CAAX protease family)